MNHYFIYSALLILGTLYGIMIQKYKIFPYKYIKMIHNRVTRNTKESYGPWSIGIYEGTSPFELYDPQDISNPVLTGEDVDDMNASFVADPFIVIKDKKYFMFFEALSQETSLGVIAYAESDDGKHWDYKKVIITENFHLSYPYAFEWNNNYYMIPESNKDLSVRLYKAVSFPKKWEYIGNLLSGYPYKDASVFQYDKKWWMFVSTGYHNILNLYYSDNLLSGWRPHPMNPIIKLNRNIASPAGRVIVYHDKPYRFTQSTDPSYGIHVFAFEITKLTEKLYEEKIVSEIPLITKTGSGWNAEGMHHIDPHKVGNKWIFAVDGRKW